MIEPINELRKRMAKGKLTQAALAREIGVSAPFLCLVLQDEKDPGDKILSYLGLQGTKVKRYARIGTTGPNGSNRRRTADRTQR